ncbi:MAG: flavin reductase family protein [Leptospiraceae bacterium]|nr:flavin reductase family protein [Leptospiraceae bacterium]
MTISIDDFKKSMGHFASGVTVITYNTGEEIGGITVSSFSSLSLDPMLVLFSIQNSVSSLEKLLNSKYYAINILSSAQQEASSSFASSKIDKSNYLKEVLKESPDEKGIYSLKESLSILKCETYKTYEGGDHTIFVAKVLGVTNKDDRRPLLYYNRGYVTI